MKQKKSFFTGVIALCLVASMNFSYSLRGYSFLKGNLCANILAQSTTTGDNSSTGSSSSTGGSSGSSTGNSSSTGGTSGSSTENQWGSDRFDVKETTITKEFNRKVYEEKVIVECIKGNHTNKCKNSCEFRTIEDNGLWSNWNRCD